MAIDFNELKKEIEELREIKEKHENLRKSFSDKIKKISEKLLAMGSLTSEINTLLSELDPSFSFKERKRRHGTTTDILLGEILFYLREHPHDEISMKWINEKYQIYGGTSNEIKKQLSKHPEVKARDDPNYKRRVLFSYKADTKLPEYTPLKISEQIKEEERGKFGIVDEQDSELKKALPKKFSYLK